ncbi:MAG: DUF2807 domain-containing protein [Flavobacteriaceae bacterium]|nr:DUF2807 domain-containing protein [Flavobacteriaceae bacterium]
MIKITSLLVMAVIVFACDSENANDCFQTSGPIVQQTREVGSFEKIIVNRDIELIIQEGSTFEVLIETGKNLISDVKVEVVGDQLQLTDGNTCNFIRDFGITKIHVTAPDIKEIRSSTQFDISSKGILNYPNLTLISEDYEFPENFAVGDFKLKVNSETLRVTANDLSFFYIEGDTKNLNLSFTAGTPRFNGENLIAQHVNIFHRGSDDMMVNPQQSIKGVINSAGDVISFNRPPLVEVEELYNGKLIFKD